MFSSIDVRAPHQQVQERVGHPLMALKAKNISQMSFKINHLRFVIAIVLLLFFVA